MTQKIFIATFFLLLLFAFLFPATDISASGNFSVRQRTDSTGRAEKTREDSLGERALIFSLDFGSDRTYNGTSDSTQGYIAPDLFYQAPSGFFTSLVVYKTSNQARSGEKDLTFGWDFKLFKHYNAEVSYVHYFTVNTDSQVRASLGNTVEFNISREYKIISPKLFIDYSFGGKAYPDFNTTFQFMHVSNFENVFRNEDELLLKPYISGTFGTLNYLKKKSDTKKKQFSIDTQFNFSALEFSLPIEYYIGRFIITTSITHSIPYNQPKYIGNNDVT
jgi:hypothetical protein